MDPTQNSHPVGENQQNPFNMTEDQILHQINETHAPIDIKFDVNSLLNLAGNILGDSTHIVDNVVQGSQQDNTENKSHVADFSSPLCKLKEISFEMSCKQASDEIAHKTTLAVLKKLSDYSWDAKAVFTLAAFASEYGESWLLSQPQLPATDRLAKSLAVLKRVPVLTKQAANKQRSHDITVINNLIKSTLQVTEDIFELERFTLIYGTKRVPALASALKVIPINVYWAVITLVAVVTQINCISIESEESLELSPYSKKIKAIGNRLKKQIEDCRQPIEDEEYYVQIHNILERPTEILEVIKLLIFPKTTEPQLFDGATGKPVKIDNVLKKRNIFLFISTLDITDDEIKVVADVHDYIKDKKLDDEYKIVWIPIEEGWNVENQKKIYDDKFKILKPKMSWYIVQQFAFTVGYKFIKKEWHFKKQPMIVLMSPQGNVLQSDAFHIISSYGMTAFPFTAEIVEIFHTESNWVETVIGRIDSDIEDWIKQKKYILFYGGSNKDWVDQFGKLASTLANDDDIVNKAKISIKLYCVEEKEEKRSKFWKAIESLFVTKIHRTLDAVTKEVQKFFSYRNESGWALLSKDSSVVLSGREDTISQAVADYKQWGEITAENFGTLFLKQHERIVETKHRCTDFEIPLVSGQLPDGICCAECPRSMEIYIHYKCCHNKSPVANAIH